MDELVAEIATASKEQSQGIGQVNTAVAQMDKVTQANAASAEESASAAEELNAQADTLRRAILGLLTLVNGTCEAEAAPRAARAALIDSGSPAPAQDAAAPRSGSTPRNRSGQWSPTAAKDEAELFVAGRD